MKTAALFLHGLGQSPASWDKVLGHMKSPGPVSCPDLFSLAGSGPVTYEKLYQGFCAFCEKEEGPLALCGLSLGAVLALAFALERPEKVSALVLIGGQCAMPRALLRVQNGIALQSLPKHGPCKKRCAQPHPLHAGAGLPGPPAGGCLPCPGALRGKGQGKQKSRPHHGEGNPKGAAGVYPRRWA